MPSNSLPATLAELRDSGYQSVSVREEIRRNLIAKIRAEEPVFPGIVGFEQTVIPQLENAILAGQDIILLGERGQAKTRLIRAMVSLLDEYIPVIDGGELNDDPFNPISPDARRIVDEMGDAAPIAWLGRDLRYSEKLATPDISIADLIGEIDPIKVAEGRHLSDETAIHYGLVPRTNRGIFCINELPDLAERIQVGLFNLMEERDVQIKGYRVRLPLDVFVVATANPEDYTNRGRIVTPLKDRYGAQIHTHYPRVIEEEIEIMEQERNSFPDEDRVFVPSFMTEIVAEVTARARTSNEINQRSGVSVRVSISNYETLISNALRRSIRQGESIACPRVSDLPYLIASLGGKIELETFGEGREDRLVEDLTKRATLAIFTRYCNVDDLDDIVTSFDLGNAVETGSDVPAASYTSALINVDGLSAVVSQLTGDDARPEVQASAVEFVLEGLHLNRRLNCAAPRPAATATPGRAGPRRLDQRGPSAQCYPIRQRNSGLQVAEHQEPAYGQRHLLGVVGDAGSQQQLDVILAGPLVSVQVAAPAHVGIDRYLNGFAGSTFPADEVNHGLPAPVADELGGFRRYFQACRHKPIIPPSPTLTPASACFARQLPPDAPGPPCPAGGRCSW